MLELTFCRHKFLSCLTIWWKFSVHKHSKLLNKNSLSVTLRNYCLSVSIGQCNLLKLYTNCTSTDICIQTVPVQTTVYKLYQYRQLYTNCTSTDSCIQNCTSTDNCIQTVPIQTTVYKMYQYRQLYTNCTSTDNCIQTVQVQTTVYKLYKYRLLHITLQSFSKWVVK